MGVRSGGKRYRSYFLTYFLAFGTVFITIAMVTYPKEAFDSAIQGLNLWWTVVFPALLPFFILSELLMGFGVVHFIGVVLEPLMRPVFNVPGVGALMLSTTWYAKKDMQKAVILKAFCMSFFAYRNSKGSN